MQDEKELLKDDSKPPIFKSWNQMYVFVLVLHAILITCFYIITKMYS